MGKGIVQKRRRSEDGDAEMKVKTNISFSWQTVIRDFFLQLSTNGRIGCLTQCTE